MMKRFKLFPIILAFIAMTSCSDSDHDMSPARPDYVKPKAMWIDTEANFELLSTKAGIDAELKKIKECGLNMIYLDVKSANGYALYKSDILPPCNSFDNMTVTRDYDDYLGYFLDRCDELGIDVIASIVTTGFGIHNLYTGATQGLIYDDKEKWYDKCQVRSTNEDPEILVNIADDPKQAVVMLTPSDPDVQQFILDIVAEIVTKYPRIKGISLDYLRYCNNDGGWYGMGDTDLEAYARYWNEDKPKPAEIVTAGGGVGSKYTKWIEYRSAVVTGLLEKIRRTVKSINPKCELHLWASADWMSRYTIGQNWASRRYRPSGFCYTGTYYKTGFAHVLDVFITGAYFEKVWKSEIPEFRWSVENFVTTWDNYIKGDCDCYGSIAAYALNKDNNADATYLCLKHTDGFMTFELSHVNRLDLWQSTREGIERYEAEASK